MKRFFKGIVCRPVLLGIMCCAQAFAAYGSENDVQIRFNLGSGNLYINSKAVETAAPYSAGQGTTMVPLRVITEAFGAEVKWDANEKKITMLYEDSEIIMYIGSKTALCNGNAAALAEAPVISDGTTMVPLRFISEKFGALVDYDSETKEVVVLKSSEDESALKDSEEESGETDASELLNVSAKDYVGDSSLGWYMKNSPSFSLADRNFDASSLVYTDSSGKNRIYIYIDKDISSSYTIDEAISDEKKNLEGKTLVSQNQSTEDGADCYELTYKTSSKTVYTKLYLKDSILYGFYLYSDNESEKQDAQVALDLFNSVKLGYPSSGTSEDLSNVGSSGFRKFEQTKLKISMSLPVDWSRTNENSDSINEFYFRDKYRTDDINEYPARIAVLMYSKEDGLTAEEWRDRDYEELSATYNSRYLTISKTDGEIGEHTYKGYKADIKYSDDLKIHQYFYYICGEDYKYEIFAALSDDDFAKGNSLDEIMKAVNSFDFEEPDKDEVGQLLENYENYEEADKKTKTVTDDTSGAAASVPVSWTTYGISSTNSSETVSFSLYSEKGNDIDLIEYADGMVNEDNTFKIITKKNKSEKMAGHTASYMKASFVGDSGDIIISEEYMFTYSNRVIHAVILYPEMYGGTRTKKLVDDIFSSVTI